MISEYCTVVSFPQAGVEVMQEYVVKMVILILVLAISILIRWRPSYWAGYHVSLGTDRPYLDHPSVFQSQFSSSSPLIPRGTSQLSP
jgi:hypothetical protein